VTTTAEIDFELQHEILSLGGKTEKIAGVGDGAYYWEEDTVGVRVGNRIVMLSVDRTQRTEAPATVKRALTNLARRVADRLRAGKPDGGRL
jgi:hypothetical protein